MPFPIPSRLICAAAIGLLLPAAAGAHATGESYVWLNVGEAGLEGRFEIRIDDLRERLGLAIGEDPRGWPREVAATAPAVQRYIREHFEIHARGAPLPYTFTGTEVVEVETLGAFAQYHYESEVAEVPNRLRIVNSLLFEGDRFHRSLLCIAYDRRSGKEYGEEFTALVFSPANRDQELDLSDVQGLLRVRDFVWQGILHIWIGIDHILFLVALLLTAVLERRPRADGDGSDDSRSPALWQPTADLRTALWNIVRIVTVFTVAHSITLSLAALDLISLPSRLVESVIAFSIVLVAANNLWPRFVDKSWLLILVFGLFHGLGFASVMGQLPFRMMHLVQVILAFNIGVELGQLAIVAAIFPVLFLLRRQRFYQPAILGAGSVVLALIAAWWLGERALGL